MQTIPQQPKTGTTEGTGSGFGAIPGRIHDLAPLVVDGDSEIKIQVHETLGDLEGQLAEVHRIAAEAYMSQGSYAHSVPHLEAAVRFAPDNLEYINHLGFAQYISGDDTSAAQAFERVLTTDPGQVDALFNLGMVRFGMGEFARAEDCFRRVLEITPNDAEAWNNRGAALFQAGRGPDAKVCFNQALQIDPNNEDAKINLASI